MRTIAARGILVIIASVVLTACMSTADVGDKSGSRARPVVLQMASTPAGPADIPSLEYFTKRVAALSGGRLTIAAHYQWGNYSADAEQQVIAAVRAGVIDLGWAGSRAFDVVGDRTFQPLSAPFLIDGYPLLQAVLASPVAARMVDSLKLLGVDGIGLVAGPLRVPIAVRAPLLSPQAWKGNVVGTYPSEVQEETIQALGARPVIAFGPFRQQRLDDGTITAFELDLRRYGQFHLASRAKYVVPNEVLWPEVDVIFANRKRMAGLTTRQSRWLMTAMRETTVHAIDIAAGTGGDFAADCAAGAHFVLATPAQLAALRRAVDVVYSAIGHDAANAQALAQISQLKTHTAAGSAQIPPSC